MSLISETFPPVEVALELEPEELAVPLLKCLCKYDEERRGSGNLNRGNFTNPENFIEYAGADSAQLEAFARAVTEAWVWLQREGLIAPIPAQQGEWIFVTRRGKKFIETGDVGQFKAANLLPPETLDPKLAAKVRPAFLRGAYDSAVFEAFKEVEIRVRTLGGYSSKNIGVNLMRDAFKPETGKLTNIEQEKAEQEGIFFLFTGAIASFKNPGSHRDVDLDDAVEAAELIVFADLLIRIAERHKPIATQGLNCE